jgi:hypothetical protein
MKFIPLGLGLFVSGLLTCSAGVTVFEAAGTNAAAIAPTVDAFRGAIGADRREINWDGVPDTFSDPNSLPGNFFNVNSPRGAVLSTPGTGFLVSATGLGSTPALFGFSSDFQTFSALKLFTAVSSNIVDVSFFLPGTPTMATTSAFGLIFVDAEVAGATSLQFFDADDNLLFARDALVGENQGLSFLGGIMDADGPQIGRVRITAGLNTIVANGMLGNPYDDVVVMDDFIYATPTVPTSRVPDSGSVVMLLGGAVFALAAARRRLAA